MFGAGRGAVAGTADGEVGTEVGFLSGCELVGGAVGVGVARVGSSFANTDGRCEADGALDAAEDALGAETIGSAGSLSIMSRVDDTGGATADGIKADEETGCTAELDPDCGGLSTNT